MKDSFDLEGLCQGNEKSWCSFYQLYAPYVKKILAWQRWRFPKEVQEELLQEIFIAILKSVKNYRSEAQIPTFISRITQNISVSAIRNKMAKKRGEGKQTVPFDEILEASLQSHDSTDIGFEEQESLKGAIQKLSKECQDLIQKRYVEEVSYEALAVGYGESISTLASRLKRCLLSLKRIYLGENNPEKCDNNDGGKK